MTDRIMYLSILLIVSTNILIKVHKFSYLWIKSGLFNKNCVVMKKFFAVMLLFASSLTLGAQNLRSGYFLDGYTYRHKLNPAFGCERGYFAIPVAGYTSLGVESNLSLSNILFSTDDGGLTTFLNPAISVDQVMSGIDAINPVAINNDISLVSLGYSIKKSYQTIELSLRTDVLSNIPADVFSWTKEYQDNLNMSGLSLNAESRLQLSYGYSRSIGKSIRIGARAKVIAGLAKINYSLDKLELTSLGLGYQVAASGSGYMASPITIKTEGTDNRVVGFGIPEVDQISSFLKDNMSFGAAFDLGISVDLFKYLTLSASVVDLGFITWKGISNLQSKNGVWSSMDMIGFADPDATIQDQLSIFREELLDITNAYVTETGGKLEDMLGMTAHLAAEFRMPFWDRLAVGALLTRRFDGDESWQEVRGSVNCAPLRWLSFTGNYAYSTFGHSYGAALNIHPAGFNLFVGLDSFKPAFNISELNIPSNPLNTNLAVGLNITFGKYKGRYPKIK